PAYGALSGNTPDAIRSGEGGRVDEATQAIKKHPADFMLWKPDPSHLMKWPSPWGEGYPGWHLECSVMAATLLGGGSGGVIDLHSGGEDNIFPHHECEIAQSCCGSGQAQFARYWFHTRFLIVEGEKMSKSKGNFFTVRDLLAKGATPAAIRLELIRTHYRSQANFTVQGLREQQRQIDRWVRLRDWLTEHRDAPCPTPGPLAQALPVFTAELANDLNVSGALGALSKAAGSYTVTAPPPPSTGPGTHAAELDALMRMNSVLAVFDIDHVADASGGDDDLASTVEAKIAERNAARAAKDWAAADRVRDELTALGVAIKDGAGGTTWTRIVQ
ncbi:MAG: hypothetical protein KDA25_05785, partial [Phycisphaerales bacterium]|nr:hypothetical protein [Phycisphaerales bacterium]